MKTASAEATPATWPPSWPQFFNDKHGRRGYTAVFNTFLDSLIADQRQEDLLLRVAAWILRRSWGNWMDSCVNAEGVVLTQTDCARELGLFTQQGEPDRKKVNPVFKVLEKRNCVRFEGQEIVVVENPLNVSFAVSSEDVGDGSDFRGVLGFKQWIGTVWKEQRPARFKAYQKAEAIRKKLLMQALTEYQTYKAEMSATGPTNGHIKVVNGSDNSAGTGPTFERASLEKLSNPFTRASSSSGSHSQARAATPQPKPTTTKNLPVEEEKVAAALSQHGHIADDDFVQQLIAKCREADPEASGEAIAHFVNVKAKLARDTGFFLTAIPKCFMSHAWRDYKGKARAAAAGAETPPEGVEPIDEDALRRRLRGEE